MSGFALCGLLFALIGFILLPPFARYKIPLVIHEVTGLDCQIAAIALDPFESRLSIKKLELKEKNGATFVSFDELSADFDLIRSLRESKLYIAELRLEHPYSRISRQKNGRFNYEDLIPGGFEQDKPVSLPPFEIASLRLTRGVLDWRDEYYKHPVEETIQPIDLEITDLADYQEKSSPFGLSLALKSGTTLNWSGSLSFAPLQADGPIKIGNLQSRQISEFFLQNQPVSLNKGVNHLESRCRIDYQKQQWHIRLEQLTLVANGFLLSEAGKKKPMIDIPSLVLRGAEADMEWRVTDDTLRVSVPKGELQIEKFTLADPGSQTLSLNITEGTVNSINVAIAYGDVLQLKAGTERIGMKNAALSLDRGKTLNVAAASITIGPVDYSLNQPALGSGLDMKAVQQSLDIRKLSAAWRTNRELQADADEVAFGKVDFVLQPQKNGIPQIVVQQDSFKAKQLSLREKAEKDALAKAAAVSTSKMQFDLNKKQLSIASAAASRLSVKLWLDKNGHLNYQTLFADGSLEKSTKRPETAASLPKPSASSKSLKASKTQSAPSEWTIAVNKLTLDKGAVDFQDRSQNPPMSLILTDINTHVENFSTASQSPFPIIASTSLNDRGKIDFNGSVTLFPVTAAMAIKIEQVPIQPFQAYIERMLNLDIMSGFLNADGKLAFDLHDPGKPLLSFKGASGISQFQTRLTKQRRDLAKWDDLTLKGVDFNLEPLRFNVAEAQAERPYLRVAINKERQINLANVIANRPEASTTSPPSPPSMPEVEKGSDMSFDIKKIHLREGSGDFSDRSLIMPFRAHIGGLNGFLAGLTSQRDAETNLYLQGEVLEIAPVEIKGTFKPSQDESKLVMAFRNLPLSAATPYIAEFAGYKIEKGKLNLDLDYHIANDKLDSTNKILIDKLTLGEKVDSPRAIPLNLRLAVALLKDSSGRINIDFPISGSLEDPKFSIGKHFLGALLNVVTKALASPFNLIAGLAGNGDEDLGQIQFNPGSAELETSEIEKLDSMAKVFAERKEFALDVRGVAFQQEDWPVLRDQLLYEQLKSSYIEELRSLGKNTDLDILEFPEEEYKRLLADWFITKFPQLGKRSLLGLGEPTLIDDKQGDFYAVAKQKLSETIPLHQRRLESLAARRGQAILSHLLKIKGIDSTRIFLIAPHIEQKALKDGIIVNLILRG